MADNDGTRRITGKDAESIINRLLRMVEEQMNRQGEQLADSAQNQKTMFRLIVGIMVFNTLLIGAFGGLNVIAGLGSWSLSASDSDAPVAVEDRVSAAPPILPTVETSAKARIVLDTAAEDDEIPPELLEFVGPPWSADESDDEIPVFLDSAPESVP